VSRDPSRERELQDRLQRLKDAAERFRRRDPGEPRELPPSEPAVGRSTEPRGDAAQGEV
jgi:hypothetical protein